MLFEGVSFVFKLALALLQEEAPNLLQLHCFEHVLNHIQLQMPINAAKRGEAILQRAAAVKLPADYLDRLAQEFDALQSATQRRSESAASASYAAAAAALETVGGGGGGGGGSDSSLAEGKRQLNAQPGAAGDAGELLPHAVARLKLALLDREAEARSLQRENSSCKQQVNHAKSALQSLRSEVEEALAERDAATARCRQLEEENRRLREALAAAGGDPVFDEDDDE